MKPKKLNKKLSLNKTTIAALNRKEIGDIKGGQWSWAPDLCTMTQMGGPVCETLSLQILACCTWDYCPTDTEG